MEFCGDVGQPGSCGLYVVGDGVAVAGEELDALDEPVTFCFQAGDHLGGCVFGAVQDPGHAEPGQPSGTPDPVARGFPCRLLRRPERRAFSDRPALYQTQPATSALVPDPLNYGWRDYRPRVGPWRLMDIFDRYHIRQSVLLNSDVISCYSQIVKAGLERNWAWLAHGRDNSTLQAGMPADEERAYLTEVVEAIDRHREPAPWLAGSGPHRDLAELNDLGIFTMPLTSCELEVLRLLAAGKSNRRIAHHLVLAPGTARKHVIHPWQAQRRQPHRSRRTRPPARA